jgi:hypothetical protein
MSIQELGKRSAVARADVSGHSGPNPTVTLRLKVEKLAIAAHGGARVTFYHPTPYTGALVPISGVLEGITQGASWFTLRVDGIYYALPAGTLVTVETREIR